MRPFFLSFILLVLASLPVSAFQEGHPQTLPLEPLSIETDGGRLDFQVQVAVTMDQKRTGLMFRTDMPDNEGMLFTYRYPDLASFWMRNTYIPLDIIFIYPDGTIANIEEMTVPLSLDSVKSIGYVTGVLEINGGLAEKLGIKPGDKIIHSFYEKKDGADQPGS